MKFKCVKDDFLKGIQISQKGVSSKSTLPILSSLLIEAKENNISLTGTDLEILVNCEFHGKIVEEGSVVVPARLIGDIVRNLPEEAVEISYNSKTQEVNIKCGKAFFSIKAVAAEDYPKTPELSVKEDIIIDKDTLINILKHVIKAASRDESRPVLTGILISVGKDKIKMVATDSYRLAVTEGKIEPRKKREEEKNVIVPTKALEEIMKIGVAGEDDKVKINVSENHILFNMGSARLMSRLIEGKYPEYKQLFPDIYKVELAIKRDEFIGAVRRVALLAQNNSPIRLALGKDKIDISAETQEVGKAEEKIGIKYEGDNIDIAFNGQYLLDGLSAVDKEDILIKIMDPLKPGLIKPVEGEEFLYLIMPVRV